MKHEAAARLTLGILAASALAVGLWAELFPHSFYTDFPGAGHHWVAVDGPYNEHLIRDVGGLNLALGVLTALAAFQLTAILLRSMTAAWLVYSLPHLIYHLAHLGSLPTTADRIGNVAALAMQVVLPGVLLLLGGLPADRAARYADPEMP